MRTHTSRAGSPRLPTSSASVPSARAAWRAVALPREHGGWGLTLEPVLLGALLAPSLGGLALGVAAFGAFVVRTPITAALVDLRRRRWLHRTRLALGVATIELAAIGALALLATRWAGWTWLVPVALAAPFVAVELAFDARSRGRRLVPELAGAFGIAAVAPAVILAGGAAPSLALGVWLILAGRNVASIPFVRIQIQRLHGRAASVAATDAAQALGFAAALTALAATPRLVAGAAAVGVLAVAQAVWVRRPPVPAKILGITQMALGIGVVVVAAIGATLLP